MKKIIYVMMGMLLFWSCDQDSQLEENIAKIKVNVNVERFDLMFAHTTPQKLPDLKQKFPFLFSKHVPDSIWIARINDTLQQQLASEVQTAFSDFSEIEDKIHSLFQHLKYYDPTFSEPRIITLTSDVDYRNKTIVTDTIDLIALDTYLGSDHIFYDGIQQYIKQNMNKDQIVSDLAGDYADKYIYQSQRKTLLDEMIYFGKRLYFKDMVIPDATDEEKIGYTKDQLDWSISNESYIWSYFIERELLFSTDISLPGRFIAPAPFSKFYLELDNESPGRIGQYIGWQIVRSFMKNNDVTPMDMLQMDADKIFNESKFKPRK